ncbi:TrbG/VirB9 family P-type conjugative transfer protein [Novosphingobium sp.]|uniref:TrbG/VirB9 family P-type conjugative transfer protein n=1 Tax=Novosphingobium sp. TaxID=1874826 RepID=UPI00333E6256
MRCNPLWPSAGLALMLGLATPAPAASANPPHPVAAVDPRVQVVEYAPDMIVPLATTPGFAVTIDFGDDEKVETVSIGDSTDWQISPNRRANLLFVKPMSAPAATNMTVVTNARVYYFALTAALQRRGVMPGGQVFALHFVHAAPVTLTAKPDTPTDSQPAAPTPASPRAVNAAYSYDGSREVLPLRVFDDGKATYFQFAEAMDLPAIFPRERDGALAVANLATRDGYVVVDRLAAVFELRRGKLVTRVYNDAFHPDVAAGSTLVPHRGKRERDKQGKTERAPAPEAKP